MAFRLSKGNSAAVDSPEALIADLRTKKIPGLLSHQADVLREYLEKAVNLPDVALQLPTGSGKTLVGSMFVPSPRAE
jgi:replicative superfamily II helicase